MGCDYKDWEQLQKNLSITGKSRDEFCVAITKEIATRLLAKVIRRTPVGDYSKDLYVDTRNKQIKYASFMTKGDKRVTFQVKSVKKGGTLRRGWTGGKLNSDGIQNILSSLKVHHFGDTKVHQNGDTYVIEIENPVPYASYVEFGHCRVNGGWTEGKFMLSMSEDELNRDAPRIIENKLKKWLEESIK